MKIYYVAFFLPILAHCWQGCGSAVPADVSEPGQAPDADGKALVVDDGEPGRHEDDQPPHRFTPRSHAPHTRPGYVPPPDLNTLPSLRLRLAQCYRQYQREEAQIATGAPALIPRRGRAAGKGAAKERRRARSARRASGAGVIDPFAAGSGVGAAKPSARAPAPPIPATEAAPPPLSRPAPSAKSNAVEAEAGADIARDRPAPDYNDEERPPSQYEKWGAKIYLSNDDTMSLSSAQRVIYAIDNFLPLPPEHVRPHELLNYFSFETAEVQPDRDFSVLADIEADPEQQGVYTLALAVRGRPVDRTSRRNAAITLVIDRSGSMRAEGRMEYLKRGLARMVDQLKNGDMVHMVLFDHNVCTPVENFVVGRDSRGDLIKAIHALEPLGSTDLHSGLSRGYEIADRSYRPHYSNRVVMITDALTNTGVTDERLIAMISRYYETRRIRLSGVGVGREFNDSLLDRLTERGKGAYLFLGSKAEVDVVFGRRFISLIETTALDVHFRLHMPRSLRMDVFYGEESSTVKEDVQAIHYFANTSQLFLSDLIARDNRLRPQDDVMLTIEYQDPETGEDLFEEYAFNLGEIQRHSYNVRKGRLIMAWVDLLVYMASRPIPAVHYHRSGAWQDEEGWNACEKSRISLASLAEGLEDDSEVRRVLDLWEKYCSRYERPRHPVRRRPLAPEDRWPGAQSR